MLETVCAADREGAEDRLQRVFAVIRDDTPVLCIDVEASGVGPDTFPLEVALADPVNGSVRSWLIRPLPQWLNAGSWSLEAEVLHGLSREHVASNGLSPEQVARELASAAAGARILSDAPHYDDAWLKTLHCAIGAVRSPVMLDDFQRFLFCAI